MLKERINKKKKKKKKKAVTKGNRKKREGANLRGLLERNPDRIRRRDILVQENTSNTNENKLLGVVCHILKGTGSDIPKEHLTYDPESYFIFLMALTEAGAMNREAIFALEKQASIIKYWPGNQIIGAVNLLLNIKPLILGLAFCVILEKYRQNASIPQLKAQQRFEPDFELFFGC
ncbi:hypothetical protein RRF57_011355 [Xylaria bambusicola]|uniref:Uncharacterized protein n=1 Tax=Xylaria bambusicola TaxID=326684 RepID=A0AAN7UXY7_9PEZI